MAEIFRGRNHTVYISNGGGGELLKILIEISMKIRTTPHLRMVRAFLTQQLNKGNGGRAFSLDPNFYFPNLFSNVDNLKALSVVIADVGHELTQSNPDLNWDILCNRKFRLKWLAKVIELYEIVNDLIVYRSGEITALPMYLDEEDTALFRYYLISDYYNETCKRQPIDKLDEKWNINAEHDKLIFLNELISIIENINQGNNELLLKLWDRLEIFILFGKKQEAIADLKRCIQLADEDDEKEFFNEYISVLSKRKRA